MGFDGRCQMYLTHADRWGSLAVKRRVFYLDAEEGPQTGAEMAGRQVVRVHAAVRRWLALHRDRQGREPPVPAAQRRDGLQVHTQPAAGQIGLPGILGEPQPGLEAGGGDQGAVPAGEAGADPIEDEDRMTSLYHDPYFTFRFAEDRLIPRFHLEGIEAGRSVSVYKIDPGTGERLGLLATATVGDGGWVELKGPILVRAGEAFIAVPASLS